MDWIGLGLGLRLRLGLGIEDWVSLCETDDSRGQHWRRHQRTRRLCRHTRAPSLLSLAFFPRSRSDFLRRRLGLVLWLALVGVSCAQCVAKCGCRRLTLPSGSFAFFTRCSLCTARGATSAWPASRTTCSTRHVPGVKGRRGDERGFAHLCLGDVTVWWIAK